MVNQATPSPVLLRHLPCPLFKPKRHVSTPKADMQSPDLFIYPLPSVATLNKSPLSAFTII